MDSSKTVPIRLNAGVALAPTSKVGIFRAVVTNPDARFDLPWDRFVRMKACADAISESTATGSFLNSDRVDSSIEILDVGGYDGALALFIDNCVVDVIDPATTGATLLEHAVEPNSYDIVCSIDALEHMHPDERESALHELASLSREFVILNYPCRETAAAQRLVLEATNNPLIREHVQWELPDSDWVASVMAQAGFTSTITQHASLSTWLGQYLTLNLAPESAAARDLNRYLIKHHADEPFSTPLYHRVICRRNSQEK